MHTRDRQGKRERYRSVFEEDQGKFISRIEKLEAVAQSEAKLGNPVKKDGDSISPAS